jgi:hypothetical protein
MSKKQDISILPSVNGQHKVRAVVAIGQTVIEKLWSTLWMYLIGDRSKNIVERSKYR